MAGGQAGLRGTRGVVAAWAAVGLVTLGLATYRLWVSGWPTLTDVVVAAVYGALLAASWVWPLTLSIGDHSDTFDLDEGFFVLLILLVPPAMTVLVFAVVAIVVQALKSWSLFRAVFNASRVVTSAGVAALVFVLLHGPGHTVGYAQVGPALVAVRVLPGAQHRRHGLHFGHARDAVAGGGVRRSLGQAAGRRRERRCCDADGLAGVRSRGVPPLAIVPLFVFRYLGEGRFASRSDRMRLRSLLEATLDVHRSIGGDEAGAAVLSSAGSLLRSPDVTLVPEQPRGEDSMLIAPVELTDRRLWLSVSGRSQTEPFDETDRALLNTLASVGAIALANADHYAEVERQKDDLSVITGSLGEGVCAINLSGEITFMNPAGAAMLGWSDLVSGDGHLSSTVEAPRFLLDPAACHVAPAQRDDRRHALRAGGRIAISR